MSNEFGPEELSALAKVIDRVERLEAENRDLKRRLESLQNAVLELIAAGLKAAVTPPIDATKVCPQCWGKKHWTERRADDPNVVTHYTCGTCGGSGRVKA